MLGAYEMTTVPNMDLCNIDVWITHCKTSHVLRTWGATESGLVALDMDTEFRNQNLTKQWLVLNLCVEISAARSQKTHFRIGYVHLLTL